MGHGKNYKIKILFSFEMAVIDPSKVEWLVLSFSFSRLKKHELNRMICISLLLKLD